MKKILYLGIRCLAIIAFFSITTLILGGSPLHYWPNYLGAAMIYIFVALFKDSDRDVSILLTAFFSLLLSMFITAAWVFFTSGENWHFFYLNSSAICIILGRIQLQFGSFDFSCIEKKLLSQWDFTVCLLLVAITNGLISGLLSDTLHSGVSNGMLIATISGIGGIVLMLLVIYVEPLVVKTWKWFF